MQNQTPKLGGTKEAQDDGDGSGSGGTATADAWINSAAAAVANDGALQWAPPAPKAAASTPSPLASATAPTGDGLGTAMPDLLMASEMFKANAFTARVAQDAYRAAMDLGRSG